MPKKAATDPDYNPDTSFIEYADDDETDNLEFDESFVQENR